MQLKENATDQKAKTAADTLTQHREAAQAVQAGKDADREAKKPLQEATIAKLDAQTQAILRPKSTDKPVTPHDIIDAMTRIYASGLTQNEKDAAFGAVQAKYAELQKGGGTGAAPAYSHTATGPNGEKMGLNPQTNAWEKMQ